MDSWSDLARIATSTPKDILIGILRRISKEILKGIPKWALEVIPKERAEEIPKGFKKWFQGIARGIPKGIP